MHPIFPRPPRVRTRISSVQTNLTRGKHYCVYSYSVFCTQSFISSTLRRKPKPEEVVSWLCAEIEGRYTSVHRLECNERSSINFKAVAPIPLPQPTWNGLTVAWIYVEGRAQSYVVEGADVYERVDSSGENKFSRRGKVLCLNVVELLDDCCCSHDIEPPPPLLLFSRRCTHEEAAAAWHDSKYLYTQTCRCYYLFCCYCSFFPCSGLRSVAHFHSCSLFVFIWRVGLIGLLRCYGYCQKYVQLVSGMFVHIRAV